MEIILRVIVIYIVLLVLFRLLGKRSMTQLTAFDFILFLIISEAMQNALVDEDRSVTMGLAVVLTFLMVDRGMSYLKSKFEYFERVAEGVPVLLVDHGKAIEEHLKQTDITISDILQTAREKQGLERMEQIKYAVLEVAGSISIVPMESEIEQRLARIESALGQIASGRGNANG